MTLKRNQFYTVTARGEIDTVTCAGTPTSEKIFNLTTRSERWIIQQVGARYEVYDRTRARRDLHGIILPIPSFVADDEDVAVMWALMQASN